MKKLLLSFLSVLPLAITAQTFSGTPGTAIFDNSETFSTFTVSGLPTAINSSFGVTQVCVNIAHTYDANLKIKLISPNNTTIMLANNNGGSGANFTNTCFAENGIDGRIFTGTAPFTGTFIPFQSINLENNGQNPNGVWQISVKDEVPFDVGTFISFAITFGVNPPPDPSATGPCSTANGAGCFCPDGSQDCDLLPDMTASASIIAAQHTETPGLITLSNATPNIGWGPMEIHSSNSCWCDTVAVNCATASSTPCPDGSFPKQKLNQTIYHKNGTNITSSNVLTSGIMSFHPTHGHVHVDNWAAFTLRTPTSNPDATTWPIVANGSKVSFCLINLGDCNSNPAYCRDGNYGSNLNYGNIPNAPFGGVSGCGTDQGIYTGSYDIYSQGLAGMSMDLTGVCNGDYYIVSITDPDNNFRESNETNNWAATPITLTMQQPKPIASFTYSINANQVQFTNPPNINYNYQWFFGDNGGSLNQNPLHTYPSNNIYYATLIVSSDCGADTITHQIDILTTGIEMSNVNVLGYSVYPNPINETTTVSYFLPEKSEVSFELYDIIGNKLNVVSKGTQEIGHYEFNYDINDLDLPGGVYILQLKTPNRTASLRIIQMKK